MLTGLFLGGGQGLIIFMGVLAAAVIIPLVTLILYLDRLNFK